MSSSIGSLHEKPILPAELSLDLGSLKARKEKLEQPPPLWKRNQEPILFATNRVSNIPSYVPRFSKVSNQTDIKHIEDATLPTESEIQATLSPREKYYRNLARPPTYRTSKKNAVAQHRITRLSESPRLCYTTPREENIDAKIKPGKNYLSQSKVEQEFKGYALLEKAKGIYHLRAKRRRALEAAAARMEPFAMKQLTKYRPRVPSTTNRRSKKRPTTGRSLKWNAESEWVKYIPTGDISDSDYVSKECNRFEKYIENQKQVFSPRSYDAMQQEELYAKKLLKESDDRNTKRIFREYKPEFLEADYRPTYLIKQASDVYARQVVAQRTNSKPAEVALKAVNFYIGMKNRMIKHTMFRKPERYDPANAHIPIPDIDDKGNEIVDEKGQLYETYLLDMLIRRMVITIQSRVRGVLARKKLEQRHRRRFKKFVLFNRMFGTNNNEVQMKEKESKERRRRRRRKKSKFGKKKD